jgi:hypothetical protein
MTNSQFYSQKVPIIKGINKRVIALIRGIKNRTLTRTEIQKELKYLRDLMNQNFGSNSTVN